MLKRMLKTQIFIITIMLTQMIFAQSSKQYILIHEKNGDVELSRVSEIDSITFCECKDYDGNTYDIVQIGDQIWMAENLKVTKYRNGDAIIPVTSNSIWSSTTSGAYCAYNNVESNTVSFGYLYNWYAVNDNRNIAPEGWHVPSDEEWEKLAQFISDDNGGYSKDWDNWNYVGAHLKSTSGWILGNGTDDYGFTGLPAGARDNNGNFDMLGYVGCFWSASEYDTGNAWSRDLSYYDSYLRCNYFSKGNGFSVRCVRD